MYGRTQFISTLITKAQEKVCRFYHLMGAADKVRDDVKWLLTQSRFMDDDIDLEVWIEIYSDISFDLFLNYRNEPTIKANHSAPTLLLTLLKVYGSQQMQDPT